MSRGKVIAFCCVFFAAIPAWSDDVADDVVSGWEFQGVFDVDKVIISEDFMVQNNWEEPVFSQPGDVRDIASLDLDGTESTSGSMPMGHLQIIEEIPYTYPWLKRWQVRNQLLRYWRKRRSRKAKK